jgi:signal transduction histidine kinase/DNA-binding response OmpR family regulator
MQRLKILGLLKYPATFRAQIFWSLVPIILSLFILVAVVDLVQNKRLAEEEFMKRGRAMATNLAHGGELGVFAEDKYLLDSSLRSVVGDADVAYIFIYGENWKILASGGRLISQVDELNSNLSTEATGRLQTMQSFSNSVTIRGERFVEFFAPILSQTIASPDEILIDPLGKELSKPREGRRIIGAARVGLSFETVNAHMAALLKLWGALTVAFLALSAVAIYVISRRITGPIIRLTEQTKRIAAGFLDQVIPVESRDEIGHLAADFNEMAQALKMNIGEKERLLEELRELNRTLEERIQQRTAEIEAINEQLQKATRHKSEFLANMSHELRTPLNAIIGFSEVLLDRMVGDINAKQEEYLQDVISSGRHLLSLINDILDLSKVEAGRMELEQNAFDLPMLLEDILKLVRERATRHGIQLSLDVDDRLGEFTADERRIKEVLLNLLSNAIKFTPDGGKICLTARLDGGFVVISVTDTGIGIAPEDQELIFEEFRQAAGEKTRKTEGTGLGLTLAKKFVELHGGSIWVKSELGRGSTFAFKLPIVASTEKKPDMAAITPVTERDGQLVLVIEDDRRSANLLSILLQETGFRVAIAQDGEEGLRKARTLRPASIMLDILLPKVDGWEFLARLKADPAIRDIPVIIVSVVDQPGKGFALGAADYLIKPVSREKLTAAIRSVRIPPEVSGSAAKVLAIDDDAMTLELIRATLEAEGYKVLRAAGGQEGIAVAKAELPALIILDLLMPDIDGFGVVDQLRDHSPTREIPIVILTNMNLTPGEKEQLNGRISYMARKGDFNRATFVDLVNRLLTKRWRDAWPGS